MSGKSTDTDKQYTLNFNATFKTADREKVYMIWQILKDVCDQEGDVCIRAHGDFNNPKDHP